MNQTTPAQPEGELRERVLQAMFAVPPVSGYPCFEHLADAALSVIEPELALLRAESAHRWECQQTLERITQKLREDLAAVSKERTEFRQAYDGKCAQYDGLAILHSDLRKERDEARAKLERAEAIFTRIEKMYGGRAPANCALWVRDYFDWVKFHQPSPPQADSGETCHACGGKGYFPEGNSTVPDGVECDYCEGTGKQTTPNDKDAP